MNHDSQGLEKTFRIADPVNELRDGKLVGIRQIRRPGSEEFLGPTDGRKTRVESIAPEQLRARTFFKLFGPDLAERAANIGFDVKEGKIFDPFNGNLYECSMIWGKTSAIACQPTGGRHPARVGVDIRCGQAVELGCLTEPGTQCSAD